MNWHLTTLCPAAAFSSVSLPQFQFLAVTGAALVLLVSLGFYWRASVTLRRHAAEAKRLALVAARTDNGVVIIDIRGEVDWINEGFTRITGYTLDEVRGKRPADVLHGPETDGAVVAQMEAALKDKRAFHMELVNYAKDGRKLWVDVEIQPLFDDKGEVTHFMGLQNDITRYKQAEAEIRQLNLQLEQRVIQRTAQLQESERRLAHILEFLPDAMLAINRQGTVIAWNRAMEKLTGMSARDMVGKSNHEYALPFYGKRRPILIDLVIDADATTLDKYKTCKREGDILVGEAEVLHGNRKRALWGKASPLYDADGNMTGAIEVIRDITERKEMEAQLRQSQKMEAIGQLASGVAHDFNNLLAVILGNTQLAMGMEEKEATLRSECLHQIVAATDRAANLTRQLLAFSRKQALQPAPVQLNELTGNLVKMLKRLVGEHIELRCDYDASVPKIQADPGMLEQVLVNLVVNARDAMPLGGQLTLRTQKVRVEEGCCRPNTQCRPGDFACLTVADTGTGIDAAHLPRIFDPFFTTKPAGQGTGLGLSTVHGIVSQHGGWVDVETEVGVGTTFKVYLPITSTTAQVVQPQPDELKPRGGKETILLVEDDEAVRLMTRRLLEHYGYRVEEAGSGRQAIADWGARTGEINLLLTDLIMPDGVGGRDLAEAMRSRAPDLRVLFTSGYGNELACLHEEMGNGHNHFLQKPCSWNRLLHSVRQSLDAA